MRLELGRDVLLFFEDRDRDTLVRGDRKIRRSIRRAIAPFRLHRQRISGFEMSFTLLDLALRAAGHTVHVNDRALARRNPNFPVAMCGYPHILDGWNLPNPAVLGPGLYDHPKQHARLASDPRVRSYIVFSDWMKALFGGIYGLDVVDEWFAGIDLSRWNDTAQNTKPIDVLVYDKIRWNRDTLVPTFRDRLLAELRKRNLTFRLLRYGRYTLESYKKTLAKSRSMLFLCEHETQGIAYQEAMASNVPILAWDNGVWLDPNRALWERNPVPATSVPYFSEDCGERFAGLDDFGAALDRFTANLTRYQPRRFVGEHLSMSRSAQLYLRAYYKAARQQLTPRAS